MIMNYFSPSKKYNIILAVNFGHEAIVRRELEGLGYSDIKVQDRRLELEGSARDIVRLNLWLRSCERVYVKLAEFPAQTFEELYQGVKGFDWGELIPADGEFPVQGRSYKSKLFSISDSQSITKKAIVDSLSEKTGIKWFKEDGARFKLEVELHSDIVTLTLDTSGVGLHLRGYRDRAGDAPLKETMAAALVQLSYWNKDRTLVDPFCGSGTIPIEAAMIARNIAPGIERDFDFIHYNAYMKDLHREERVKAMEAVDYSFDLDIRGSDIDKWGIERSRSNAENAGVLEDINFSIMDAKNLKLMDNYGVLISNPPYGERMGMTREIRDLYTNLGRTMRRLPTWSSYVLTSFEDFEDYYGKKADRKRKFYNGRLKVDYYQFFGPRPPF